MWHTIYSCMSVRVCVCGCIRLRDYLQVNSYRLIALLDVNINVCIYVSCTYSYMHIVKLVFYIKTNLPFLLFLLLPSIDIHTCIYFLGIKQWFISIYTYFEMTHYYTIKQTKKLICFFCSSRYTYVECLSLDDMKSASFI